MLHYRISWPPKRAAVAVLVLGLLFVAGTCPAVGTIAGSVQDVFSNGLASVWVDIYSSGGSWLDSAFTEVDGSYTVDLAAGDYYVRTFAGFDGYVDEWHSNVAAYGWSIATDATVVPVVDAATATVNFTLVAGGTIRGTVADGGAPVSNVWVDAYTTNGTLWQSGLSATNGDYEITGIRAGLYFVRTDAYGTPYPDEWFDDVAVRGDAIPTNAFAITVVGSQVSSNINFALAGGAAISGTVIDSASNAVTNAWVDVYTPDDIWLDSAATDNSGNYVMGRLPAGGYYLRTYVDGDGFADEWYDDVPVRGQQRPPQAMLVDVVAGQTTTNITFLLAPEALIGGVVTNSTGGAVTNVRVDAYADASTWVGGRTTDVYGAYLIQRLPTGPVYVRTDAISAGFADEWYNDVPAAGSGIPGAATSVLAIAGVTNNTVDFGLAVGGSISGTVRTSEDVPLAGVYVDAYDASDVWIAGATVSSNGAFTIVGLAAGDYYLRTEVDPLNYVDEWYTNIPAAVSSVSTAATPVTVSSGAAVEHIDFRLDTGAVISGTLSLQGVGPLSDIDVTAFMSNYVPFGVAASGIDGTYAIVGVPAGVHFLRTGPSPTPLVDRWYLDVNASGGGIPSNATPVIVAGGATNTAVDITLAVGGTIAGRVTDTGGVGVVGIGIDVFGGSDKWIAGASTDATGAYAVAALPIPGSYRIRAHDAYGSLAEEWYDNVFGIRQGVPDGAAVVPMPLVGYTNGIDFELVEGGFVAGVITDEADSPLAGISVDIVSTSGTWYAEGVSMTGGQYVVTRVPPGCYVAATYAAGTGFQDEWYQNVPAVGNAIPTNAAKLSVNVGDSVDNIDFSLATSITDLGTASNHFWFVWQAASGTVYAVEQSTDMVTWTNAPSGAHPDSASVRTSSVQNFVEYRSPEATTRGAGYRIRILP